jgi:hypothetical protein
MDRIGEMLLKFLALLVCAMCVSCQVHVAAVLMSEIFCITCELGDRINGPVGLGAKKMQRGNLFVAGNVDPGPIPLPLPENLFRFLDFRESEIYC